MCDIAVRPAKASSISGVSRSVIFAAIAAGELRSFRVGASRLIYVDELRAWLERHVAADQAGAQ